MNDKFKVGDKVRTLIKDKLSDEIYIIRGIFNQVDSPTYYFVEGFSFGINENNLCIVNQNE